MVALPAAELTPARLRDADLVLVRSTVQVDEALLGGSRARFVATATIGTDHLDTAWLDRRGIRWASAPGSNADSVAEWLLAALLTLAARQQRPLVGPHCAQLTLGVVGVGQVGRRVARLGQALGWRVIGCDPPRARAEPDGGFIDLDTLLAAADIVTFHTPLTRQGSDATWHLLDRARIARLRPTQIIVNASRGAVVDARALAEARAAQQLAGLVLDVYEDEPAVDPAVVAAADLATPHIAGHSFDGKANGTVAVYEAACTFLSVVPRWSPRRSPAWPPAPVKNLSLDARSSTDEGALLNVLRRFYRIEDDDAALRRITRLPPGERGPAFAGYRGSYPVRRELSGLRLQMTPPRRTAISVLEALGVQLVHPDAPG